MAEEYETDPDEAKPSLAMRRRQASDDEEEEGDAGCEKSPRPLLARRDSRNGTGSDGDSDGQGGVAKYDDDDEAADDEVEDDGDDQGYVEVDDEGFAEGVDADYHDDGVDVQREDVEAVKVFDGETSGTFAGAMAEGGGEGQVAVEEIKKQNEPFAVPTAGAFYMHDDRFRGMSRGRNRRTFGGRGLWESKDNRKWGHDKFEEMAVRGRRYDEGRKSSKGPYRTGSRNHGSDKGYARGVRPRLRPSNEMPDIVIKDFRGRGPRRYEPILNGSNKVPQTQNRRSGKAFGRSSQASSHGLLASVSNGFTNPVPTKNQAFASSLSSASPPFYPSGSSNKEVTAPQEKGLQAGASNNNSRFQVVDERHLMPQSSALLRTKSTVDGTSMEKLYLDDFAPSANIYPPRSGSSSRFQGKGSSHPAQMPSQPNPSHKQVSRALPTRPNTGQSPAHNQVQPLLQPPSLASVQHFGGGSQSSPPKTSLSFEHGETESAPEPSKSRNALVGKGRVGAQGSERGSFLYSGATGSMGVSHGDQKFPTTPAFLPVMQFAGKHPGGIGVPAVGMAFPGYVAQPQLGLGNSEMTWLPVLAGAGALGASYCSPYMAVDGAFQTRPSGQTSSAGASSEENSTSKLSNEWKPSSRPEPTGDEFEQQRQNKPRRYSEMSFGH